LDVPAYRVRRMRVTLLPAEGQGPPRVLARLAGSVAVATYEPGAARPRSVREPVAFTRTVELVVERGRHLIASSIGGVPAAAPAAVPRGSDLGGVRLEDVAAQAGLDFRHGAFRFGVSGDEQAMMGGGLCWLDYDSDGWLDLFVVNSYADSDLLAYEARGGLPRTALFRNERGRFRDVSREARADLPVRGSGCVAADLDGDGHTDLFVTTAGYNVATDGYDALLWNEGDGTFREGARAAGVTVPGWHAGAAAGDVNGDGRPDLVVAGYTDASTPIPGSAAGFPSDHRGERDLLYLNAGEGPDGRPRFREVGRAAGLEAGRREHGLGAVLVDVDGDRRLDLYVANDADPNRLYRNVAWPGGAAADPQGLGFRLEEVARAAGVDDPNAGMGIAAADFSGDGRPDLLVTNARGQLHAAYRSRRGAHGPAFADARPALVPALGSSHTGWGASFADLDLDGDLDLALANGAIPITRLARSAERVQVVENLAERRPGTFAAAARAPAAPAVNGRGLAAADYDNDGDLDLAVNAIGGRLLLLRSEGAHGHWLSVALPRFAPGTVVAALLPDGRRLVRYAQAGSSYLSSEDPRVHLGLGAATRVRELRVAYPDGRRAVLRDVRADRLVRAGAGAR
ncbi:MAG TPA: CRTAC1 family protein, partial [Gaiellaceae bacterium]|nr:CRTAC1 family protein [Gaiellaceae bacterium]